VFPSLGLSDLALKLSFLWCRTLLNYKFECFTACSCAVLFYWFLSSCQILRVTRRQYLLLMGHAQHVFKMHVFSFRSWIWQDRTSRDCEQRDERERVMFKMHVLSFRSWTWQDRTSRDCEQRDRERESYVQDARLKLL
jgi:hypothetical protein